MTMQIGTKQDGSPLAINADDLTTHGVILGRTGSGKTGATVTAIEEAALSGASVIVLDPKGDLTNLALAFPSLRASDFAPWIEPGQDADAIASRARSELGSLAGNVAKWSDKAEVTIYAPGKTHGGGRPVNVLSSLGAPVDQTNEQILRDHASSLVASILSAIGHNGDPMTDPANVFLTDVVLDTWKARRSSSLEMWAEVLNSPPDKFQTIDGIRLEDFFPRRKRMNIARAIVGFRRQAAKWLDGDPLNIDNYIGVNKSKVSVFTMRHLNEDERQFFAAMLLSAVVDYMFRAPASNKLKLLVVLDEARGYLPPYPKNPPTKRPVCTLLAQGRAQGIGMLIGTQNPNDLDYKALTNVGTWWLGNLRARDCARDLKKELADRNVDQSTLSSIPQRHFLVLKKDGEHAVTKIRWAYSFLRGPLNSDELDRLGGPSVKFEVGSTRSDGDVSLTFSVSGHTPGEVNIYPQFSINGGQTWAWCALSGHFQSYAYDRGGRVHHVTWHSEKDLGRRRVAVLLRLVVAGKPGGSDVPVLVNNEPKSLLSRLF
ncbi:MAG: ATP-binding protein [Nitrospira sp.]